MQKQIKYLIPIIALFAIFTNLNCTAAPSNEQSKNPKIAPDFTLSTLAENKITLSQFKNEKNVLIAFGATWCPYCVDEIPELKNLHQEYNDKELKILYVDIQESPRAVEAFVKKHSIPYTVLLDVDGKVAASYGVRGIPHLALVDKNGSIFYEGTRPYGGIDSLIKKLITD